MSEQHDHLPPEALSARAELISACFERGAPLSDEVEAAVRATISDLDEGRVRVATTPSDAEGEWVVHAWVKQAILLYFRVTTNELMDDGVCTYLDKIPPKRSYKGVRVVPPGVARYGSFLEEGTILMPGYVNIGARVGAGSMVDTWATVGSCAQIGASVHL